MTLKSTEASPASENEDTKAPDQVTDTGVEVSNEDANSAESSNADNTDAKQEPTNLLDVVKGVVDKKEPAEEESSTSEAAEGSEAKTDEAKAEEVEDVAEADVPFHNHPRWKAVIEERNALRPEAENYRKITGFMDANGLTGPEVAEGFEIMALLKSGDMGNLTKARDWFAERLQSLNEHLGEALPDDLQQKVNDGLVDEVLAKELARERSQRTHLETKTAERTRQDEETRRASETQRVATDMATAVQQWEDGIKAKDPDYAAKKAKLVETQALAIVARDGKRPQNRDEAVALVDRAYREVNDNLKVFAPKPKPVAASPAGLSARATATPNSIRDVVDAALTR
ncbi:hypothetical protein BSL82_15645 [Tardibacter chloracetimidivorans]|uniref:Uncharacterized protein n=1 Tax=Tardibacter chloracetimidivorans TaxID=1921510 RepID=A0A1L3ZY28_9SPHN|nr:hypothetical protein [Tardibacter chloracetimidivorans]API60538.1 hypothetical protein BSL82_15645 [Tardibacter chloracetimidivorans]